MQKDKDDVRKATFLRVARLWKLSKSSRRWKDSCEGSLRRSVRRTGAEGGAERHWGSRGTRPSPGPTHQRHAQEGHARVRQLVVPQHQGLQPLLLLLEALADVGQTCRAPVGKSRLWSKRFSRGQQCGSHCHPRGAQNLLGLRLSRQPAWAPRFRPGHLLPWPSTRGSLVPGQEHPSRLLQVSARLSPWHDTPQPAQPPRLL